MSIMIGANVYDSVSAIISLYIEHAHTPDLKGALDWLADLKAEGWFTVHDVFQAERRLYSAYVAATM